MRVKEIAGLSINELAFADHEILFSIYKIYPMTCHNRKEKTLRCLEKLNKQQGISHISLSVYLVDDGSTDGTYTAVREKFPEVVLLQGDGNLYWTKGMHKAMAAAMAEGYYLYLWLNDDVKLYEDALETLLHTYNEQEDSYGPGIVIGSICDPETGKWTYGASRKTYTWYPLRFTPIVPDGNIQEADNFWGNVVLIPHKIAINVGNLDQRFLHGGGDHDYALRAQEKGYKIWNAPNYVGECPRNPIRNSWEDSSLSLLERYKKMFDKKAMPLKTRYVYIKKHGGILFPFIFLYPYLKLPFSHVFSKIKNWLS